MDWIKLAQDMLGWWIRMKTMISFRVV